VARRPELVTTDAARQLVADRVVASQLEVALAGHPDMRRYRIDVESIHGQVTLDLPAGADPDVAVAVAKEIAGVQNVKLRIAELPVVTPFPG
jgi:osmotically-inducible protein OsmY